MTAPQAGTTRSASAPAPSPQGAAAQSEAQSIGQLLGEVSKDLSTLMRQEVELAKAEIKTEVAKAGKGAGMLGGAGFSGYMVVLFVSIAAWWGLANVMDESWAALIVAGVWALIAGALAVLGRATLKKINPTPERTIATSKEIPDALTPNS